ncbi:MAG: aldolase [Dehalococcoidales bacterium]|nr:aldolase [Dehalococcoidales bacterium]
MLLTQFQTIGSSLFTCGLISGCGGNLSVRMGDRIFITRRGSNKGSLEENDIIETGIFKNDRQTPLASSELWVHRAIYQQTPASAIVHAHPPHAVALSLSETEIVPIDDEGKEKIGAVPVIGCQSQIVPGAYADKIAQAFVNIRIVMVRGHGSFAIGQILEEAFDITSTFEESCKVLCLTKSLQAKPVTE